MDYNRIFSHIYCENEAFNYTLANQIIEKMRGAKLIGIDHYKDVFNRTGQNFHVQKNSQKLILAVKKDSFFYEGSGLCHGIDGYRPLYASQVLNCIYDCEYCYLQGTYPSSNIVIFVNTHDFLNAVNDELAKGPVHLAISYDSDLFALENLHGLSKHWIDFSRGKDNLLIEIRTKNKNYEAISSLLPADSFLLSWTILPDTIIQKYENGTSSLEARLKSVKMAIADGWQVRLCIDPVIYTDEWKQIYKNFLQAVFEYIDKDKLHDVTLGAFRMPSDYFKRSRKSRLDSEILSYPYEVVNGICKYPSKLEHELINYIKDMAGITLNTI